MKICVNANRMMTNDTKNAARRFVTYKTPCTKTANATFMFRRKLRIMIQKTARLSAAAGWNTSSGKASRAMTTDQNMTRKE